MPKRRAADNLNKIISHLVESAVVRIIDKQHLKAEQALSGLEKAVKKI